jgi:hypothetical protein
MRVLKKKRVKIYRATWGIQGNQEKIALHGSKKAVNAPFPFHKGRK